MEKLKEAVDTWPIQACRKRKRNLEKLSFQEGRGDPVLNNITQLPLETICYILSLLPVRDGVRARFSTALWKDLPDYRPVLHFDPLTVFGKQIGYSLRHIRNTKFVNIVHRFMEVWMGQKMGKLVVEFSLVNEHASHIDSWVETSIRKGVEEIQLNFRGLREGEERYVFPSHLLNHGKAGGAAPPCRLKNLSLTFCKLHLSRECISWLCNLTALHLSRVPLAERGIRRLLSGASNLLSLSLHSCPMPFLLSIHGPHLRLKKLSIQNLSGIQLNCPCLEVFEYSGHSCRVTLIDVPLLREISHETARGYAYAFDHLTANSPSLEALSLTLTSQVQPFFASLARRSLKKLNIRTIIPKPFDLRALTCMLNACPLLQIFELQCSNCYDPMQVVQTQFPEQPHFELKTVKFSGAIHHWNVKELAAYLLKNAVALEQIFIQDRYSLAKIEDWMPLQEISPSVQVVILGRNDNYSMALGFIYLKLLSRLCVAFGSKFSSLALLHLT
ncbi:unnamed protein product [Cuscuta epithymum]|uniref:At1g61320/AtMIF1 LRR domain-containing protein n=1 Tax=Cuscuta epithymum TaxID=186058 RepID=A0AAV0CH16_9ASTE|nr:unnamed protein product [Cuscuta epithymum]